jgi:hypothetical protein
VIQAAELEQGRGWRAAAWLLERIFPGDYAARARDRDQFQEMEAKEIAMEHQAEEQRLKIEEVDRAFALAGLPPFSGSSSSSNPDDIFAAAMQRAAQFEAGHRDEDHTIAGTGSNQSNLPNPEPLTPETPSEAISKILETPPDDVFSPAPATCEENQTSEPSTQTPSGPVSKILETPPTDVFSPKPATDEQILKSSVSNSPEPLSRILETPQPAVSTSATATAAPATVPLANFSRRVRRHHERQLAKARMAAASASAAVGP